MRRGQPQPPPAALGAPPQPPQEPIQEPPVPRPQVPQQIVVQPPMPQPPPLQGAQPPVAQGEGIAFNNGVPPHVNQGNDLNFLINEPNGQQGEAYRPHGIKQLGAPLGKFVDDGLKAKIWRGDFVDLPLLLSNSGPGGGSQPLALFNIDGQLCLKSQAEKPKEIFNIDKWTAAFFVFMSIYLQRHPQRAIELIKYTDVVRKLAQRFPGSGWVLYDKEFRLEQAIDPTRSWAHYDSDLFLEKLAMPVFAIQQQASRREGAPRGNSQVTQGRSSNSQKYCFNFNKGICNRTNCWFPHKCATCLGLGHSTMTCTSAQNKSKGPHIAAKGTKSEFNQGGNFRK